MKYLVLFFLSFAVNTAIAQTYNLSISIPNLNNKEGEIQIGLYNNAKKFPKDDGQYKVLIIKTDQFSGTYTIKDLPKGEYAVALMHDENADKICNLNFLGIPKEGYGFSKNVKPKFSAPSFNDCKFDLSANTTITIKIIY